MIDEKERKANFLKALDTSTDSGFSAEDAVAIYDILLAQTTSQPNGIAAQLIQKLSAQQPRLFIRPGTGPIEDDDLFSHRRERPVRPQGVTVVSRGNSHTIYLALPANMREPHSVAPKMLEAFARMPVAPQPKDATGVPPPIIVDTTAVHKPG